MDYRELVVEVDDYVATVTLNNPEMRNPLTNRLVEELMHALSALDADDAVRAIVLTGSGSAFCAGGNIQEFAATLQKTAPELYKDARRSTPLFQLGSQVRTPLIAAVNGAALGGGCGLAAMCHLALASDKAKFGTTELKLGLVPFVILPWIRRAVGERKALQMMLTAQVFTAQEAKELGLVHKVVAHEELLQQAHWLARQIASYSPLAVGLSLNAFYTTEQAGLTEALDYLSTLRIVSFLSEDLREGSRAFLEKRKPEWKGR
ncbi:enoyl-CoA hydratase/isomerase family protein [Alicyclobacillus tolerans]|uniref:enoyl-CoA hydratase/isomerase family protein n=1 Tax=Alicyclobacillus tolerans TaxID=90970 RepID=UPI001EFF6AF3|nr:enoyl-CoA hydratase-related protein [Alicyclobacillus tolerans]MCF8563247.1 enoyl-CoA hydratase/isomerase family protein [Alicyclobacillus tolerans]